MASPGDRGPEPGRGEPTGSRELSACCLLHPLDGFQRSLTVQPWTWWLDVHQSRRLGSSSPPSTSRGMSPAAPLPHVGALVAGVTPGSLSCRLSLGPAGRLACHPSATQGFPTRHPQPACWVCSIVHGALAGDIRSSGQSCSEFPEGPVGHKTKRGGFRAREAGPVWGVNAEGL